MTDRLTALEVQKQEFPRRLRGYDAEEVRLFLNAVAEEMGRLNMENAELKEEVGRLRDLVEEHSRREQTLQDTLVTAHRMSEDLRHRSEKESELMVKEARIKAEKLLERAQAELSDLEAEISRIKLERDAFENRLRAAIEEHTALLDLRKNEQTDPDNVRYLRRRGTSTDVG